MQENINPQLRFKDNNGNDYPDWEVKTLGVVLEYTPSTLSLQDSVDNGKYKVFMANGSYFLSNTYYMNTQYIAIVKDGSSVGKLYLYPANSSVIATLGHLSSKQQFNILYIYYNLLTLSFKQFIKGATIPHVYYNDYKYALIPIPHLEEQKKIAEFLSEIDKQIENVTNEVSLKKTYKKGLLQRLFPQVNETNPQLRFKDNNGNDYPDWEVKTLGDVAVFYNGLTGKNKQDFITDSIINEGYCKYITYSNIYKNSVIDIKLLEKVKVNINEAQNIVESGDILFTMSSETAQEIAMSSVYLNNTNPVYLNSFSLGAKLQECISPYFAVFLFRIMLFRKQAIKLAQGTTRYNISANRLKTIALPIPSLEEQKKIAEFLSIVDEQIENVTNEVLLKKTYKKGLLQRLFPKI